MKPLMSAIQMSYIPKSLKRCKSFFSGTTIAKLEKVLCFLEQLTIATAAASFYAITFVAFVSFSVPLVLCFDIVYLAEVPIKKQASYDLPHTCT